MGLILTMWTTYILSCFAVIMVISVRLGIKCQIGISYLIYTPQMVHAPKYSKMMILGITTKQKVWIVLFVSENVGNFGWSFSTTWHDSFATLQQPLLRNQSAFLPRSDGLWAICSPAAYHWTEYRTPDDSHWTKYRTQNDPHLAQCAPIRNYMSCLIKSSPSSRKWPNTDWSPSQDVGDQVDAIAFISDLSVLSSLLLLPIYIMGFKSLNYI